jgi:hypothetical protein
MPLPVFLSLFSSQPHEGKQLWLHHATLAMMLCLATGWEQLGQDCALKPLKPWAKVKLPYKLIVSGILSQRWKDNTLSPPKKDL